MMCSPPSAGFEEAGVGQNTCRPQGDTCSKTGYVCGNSTNANDCCDNQGNRAACVLDPLGVPRCMGVGCVGTGMQCTNDNDCCGPDGGIVPCVPGPNGTFVCAALNPDGGGICQMQGQTCTINADCCNGQMCNVPPGGTDGTCAPLPPPPPPPVDAGGIDAAGTDAPPPPPVDASTCSLYGQSCMQQSDCCNGIPCIGNICRIN
jgi:hypothetical protein